jgi:hypothetical protein
VQLLFLVDLDLLLTLVVLIKVVLVVDEKVEILPFLMLDESKEKYCLSKVKKIKLLNEK